MPIDTFQVHRVFEDPRDTGVATAQGAEPAVLCRVIWAQKSLFENEALWAASIVDG